MFHKIRIILAWVSFFSLSRYKKHKHIKTHIPFNSACIYPWTHPGRLLTSRASLSLPYLLLDLFWHIFTKKTEILSVIWIWLRISLSWEKEPGYSSMGLQSVFLHFLLFLFLFRSTFCFYVLCIMNLFFLSVFEVFLLLGLQSAKRATKVPDSGVDFWNFCLFTR